jgi:arabinofuranan 3-O-arabinosyltransferase
VNLVRRLSPRTAGLLLIAVVALFAGPELYAVLGGWIVPGIDFLPLRSAATGLLDGTSVFADPLFVYPPTAAVALLPTAFGSVAAAFAGWVVAGAVALLLAALLIARAAPRPHRLAIFALATMGLLGGVLATRSLFLGNLSELLVPIAVGVLLAFHRGRWVLGCALLAASLLIKPLLAPLLLVPILHRRWTALLCTMLPAGALLVLSVLLVPGGLDFPQVLRYVVGGTNLHGANAINNLSLRGWAEGQGGSHAAAVAASAAVVGAVLWRVTRGGSRLSPVWLGNVLLLTTFLAGGISEVHFLLSAYAGILLFVVVHRLPARIWLRFLPGLLLLAVPGPYPTMLLGRHNDGQTWLVAAELLLFAALLATPVGGIRPAGRLRRAVPMPA